MTSGLDDARLAVLVHEVRSPVAALSAVAEAITEPDHDDTARRELVRLAIAACRAIERVVVDVAVASVRLGPLDLAIVVREAVAAHVLRGNDIVADGGDEPLGVDGDPVRLRQVLDNLLTNAFVHGGGAAVVVRAARAGEDVHVSVSDAGPGIPTAEHEKIFELGFHTGEPPGAGLGLALVHAIVEAHGGSIAVDSTPGSGATFTVVLPGAGSA
jgi:signal transduction histidine kinase